MSDANEQPSLFSQTPDPAPVAAPTEAAPPASVAQPVVEAPQVIAAPMAAPMAVAPVPTESPKPSVAPAPARAASVDAPAAKPGRLAWLFGPEKRRAPDDSARRVLIAGRVILGAVSLCFLGLLGRVAHLQTKPPESIANLIDSQKSKIVLHGRRGTLRDRQGRPMAIARPAKRLFVDPTETADIGTISETIGYELGYDPMWVATRMAPRLDKRYIVLDKRLSDQRVDKSASVKIPGVGLETYLVRDYPQVQLGAQLLGFVNKDGKGLEGVERLYDTELRGTSGSIGFLRDAQRRPLWIESNSYRPPTDGATVRLSIDLIIQSIAETELAKACTEFQAQSGEVVVLDPYTGEALAIASYPFLDANKYGSTPPDKRRIRAITDTYEPGSTFKPFIWAAALEQGVFRNNEMFDCTTDGGYRFPSGRHLRDAHPSGMQTGEGVLIKSSNIGMGKIAERMGKDKAYKAMKAFGFGDSTNIGLPGEVRGRVWPVRMWSGYTITSISMGQEVAVTPLQMARAFSVFANGGLLVSPTIRSREDSSEDQQSPVFQRVLKPATAEHTRQVLRKVVTEGTGRRADSALYTIFGKTGTAQVAAPNGKGYIPDAYIGSFICGAPVDNPRLVVICVIHRPNRSKGYYGGVIAAPAARAIVEQSLIYLGVQPDPIQPQGTKVAMRIDD